MFLSKLLSCAGFGVPYLQPCFPDGRAKQSPFILFKAPSSCGDRLILTALEIENIKRKVVSAA